MSLDSGASKKKGKGVPPSTTSSNTPGESKRVANPESGPGRGLSGATGKGREKRFGQNSLYTGGDCSFKKCQSGTKPCGRGKKFKQRGDHAKGTW